MPPSNASDSITILINSLPLPSEIVSGKIKINTRKTLYQKGLSRKVLILSANQGFQVDVEPGLKIGYNFGQLSDVF